MLATVTIVIFLMIFGAAAAAGAAAWNVTESKRKRTLDRRLQRSLDQHAPELEADLLKKNVTSGVAWWARLLDRFPFTETMRKHLTQAALRWSVGLLVALMLVSGILALNLLLRLWFVPVYLVPVGAGLAAFFPYGYVLRKRTIRMERFEEQFPEALDFLARAMRAGHAFSISLELLADESADPVGGEFRQTFDEHSLGLPLEVALPNLGRRMPMLDVRFFVAAVLLQTRTGGNLSEILTNLSYVIRERFKLKGQVRSFSAHGRMTGRILTLLPVVVVLLMLVVNPAYMRSLYQYPYGKHLIGGAIVMQGLGYLVIRKIVNIRV